MIINEKELFGELSIEEIECILKRYNKDEIFDHLASLAYSLFRYKNLIEWNRLVRICECLTIIGWRDMAPFQAYSGQYVNGNPCTVLLNQMDTHVHTYAVWSKRKDGLRIEPRSSYYYELEPNDKPMLIEQETSLYETVNGIPNSQRNYILKNPIVLRKHYHYSGQYKLTITLLEELATLLLNELNVRRYGNQLQAIQIFYQLNHSKGEESTFRLLRFSNKHQVQNVELYISMKTMQQPRTEQIKEIGFLIAEIVNKSANKLSARFNEYDFYSLIEDLKTALKKWE